MTISEAMEAAGWEYDRECAQARADQTFNMLMGRLIGGEYEEIDRELPGYVADIARAHGVIPGTVLPDYVYQMARMVFRMGMRTQRKLDHPDEPTTMFWRSDQEAV
jgi:hypothetical protein